MAPLLPAMSAAAAPSCPSEGKVRVCVPSDFDWSSVANLDLPDNLIFEDSGYFSGSFARIQTSRDRCKSLEQSAHEAVPHTTTITANATKPWFCTQGFDRPRIEAFFCYKMDNLSARKPCFSLNALTAAITWSRAGSHASSASSSARERTTRAGIHSLRAISASLSASASIQWGGVVVWSPSM